MTGELAPRGNDERMEIVRSLDRLEAVGPAWRELWQRIDAPIFQSHAWVTAWWSTITDRDRRQLLIVLAWRGETLEAVLPLATSRRRGMRMLEWAAKDCTDYCDALVNRGTNVAVLRRMWKALSAEGGFDVVHLNRLLPQAAAWSLLERIRGGVALSPNHRSEHSLRVVGPWTSGEAWFDAHAKKVRQNYKRGVKFLGEGADLAFRLLPADAPLEPILDRLGELKRLWLARNGIEAPLFDEGSPTLRALVKALADAGQLRIFVLERDGVVVAISVNFVQAGTMMAFLTTYDPAVERGSPGMVLMVDYIRWAFDNGLTMVDFLCGAEEFKSRFATSTVTLESLAGSRTVVGGAAMLADRLVHQFRKIKGWQPAPPDAERFA